MKTAYRADIILGERYRDRQTGIVGVATAITFFQYGCERVNLETVVEGKIEDVGFDVPRVEHFETGERATSTRTGGPAKGVSHVRPGAVSR